MARRYDARTTIFSPEGRLYQVEYAMTAISHAGTAVGILTQEGIVLAAEKKVTSKLLERGISSEKMYRIAYMSTKTDLHPHPDNHIACAVAGITADANILVNYARQAAQRYTFTYQEPDPVEDLVRTVCDLKQGYTQYGGLRPYGVAFLYAGWDQQHGYQLYQSDPSGNYGGWKATAIGSGHQAATSILKSEYKEELSLQDALKLAVRVLSMTMDSTALTADKLEFSTLVRSPQGQMQWAMLGAAEIDALVKATDLKKPDDM